MGKNILVTGGHGFIGRRLVQRLIAAGHQVVYPPHRQCDLTNHFELNGFMQYHKERGVQFDYCFHLAARVGGIGANMSQPAQFFRDNILMGMNIISACLNFRVGKLIFFGTTCSYPANNAVPFRESDLFSGYPEPTNAPYGVAKLALLTALQAYRRQYGLSSVYLVPTNTYGPGDNFDPNTSHVIPALIRKFSLVEMGVADNVIVWGDGTPTRDLIYVDDVVEAALLAAERLDRAEPLNVGTGVEVSINDIADLIRSLMNVDAVIIYDRTQPNGQMRRCLAIDEIKRLLNWQPRVTLEDGLKATIDWWRKQTR